MRDPIGLVAAVLLGALAAAVTAARATQPLVAVPVGLGVAALVFGVYAGTSKLTRRTEAGPTGVSAATRLLRQTCLAATAIRTTAVPMAGVDQAVASTAKVVDLVYRLARQIAGNRNTSGTVTVDAVIRDALSAMNLGADKLDLVAQRLIGAGAREVAAITDDLASVVRSLESTERAVASRLT